MFSTAQSQCLACAGGRDMHYAGKKEVYLHLRGEKLHIFLFSFSFFLLQIQSHLKKKKSPCVSSVSFK